MNKIQAHGKCPPPSIHIIIHTSGMVDRHLGNVSLLMLRWVYIGPQNEMSKNQSGLSKIHILILLPLHRIVQVNI